ncbi:tRNA pseudouridine(38-40) synthase TruA [Abyssibacter sp.]|uniref:tRNA pseudouridine(38-40) synthase TruA n=1 Tax=Abyssibacter sp. TaxID=2320200 RepID=UPI0025C62F8D|nr:tRNA pseudouridine(38-40) synthase TruA [Abyssibacter sp.]
MRFAAGVEYLGTRYAGWQAQKHSPGVQADVEAALSAVANTRIGVICAGRTDAGVHGLGQVVHFDSPVARPTHSWMLGANTSLPADISIRWVRPVDDAFHARYTAVGRRYRYVIHNSRSRSAIWADRAAWWSYALDADRMHAAGQVLVGEHDFSSFRASECQSSTPWRRVDALQVRRLGAFVLIDIQANAFVHHMVRNIAGTLLEIGQGKRDAAAMGDILAARDRKAAGVTGPAGGLYFVAALYPPPYDFPSTDSDTALFGPPCDALE